jgi:membrane-bound lytic murein transglycosylase D
MFQDWTLALAAYNCGEGNVLKAIARANGKRDYWEIYPYLPKETRNYVPLFIAANYAITYYKEHRLSPKELIIPLIDTFMVNSKLHFEQIANTINLPVAELRELNPQYKRDVIPGNERPYELRIPAKYTNTFIEKEKEIYNHNGTKYFNTNIVITPTTVKNNKSKSQTIEKNKPVVIDETTVTHEIKSGENLGLIASKYGIKLADLCAWNNLQPNSKIYPGQKLVVNKKQRANTTASATNSSTTASNNSAEKKYHTIESGDSFWAIAQKYNISIDSLLELNNMTKNSKLLPGNKILLP